MLALMIAAVLTTPFNSGWEFVREPADGFRDARDERRVLGYQPSMECSLTIWDALMASPDWTRVSVPHDWAIEGPFDPFGNGDTGRLPYKGVGYYRNAIELTTNEVEAVFRGEARYHLVFDGVMCRSRVFVNGVPAGGNDYGYMSFRVDLSPVLRPGKNTVVVRADTLALLSRWYPGAGIFRPVRLERLSGDYVVPDTMRITYEKLEGAKGDSYRVTASFVAAKSGAHRETFDVLGARRWDVDDPHLYTFTWDGQDFRYGLRDSAIDGEKGYFLNGRRLPIRGVCLHADMGILGMAFNRSVMRRQLMRMKEMGANAIRTSHNAPAPELLDLCDELGFVVWDECFDKWDRTSGRPDDVALEDYIEANLRRFVRRDRLHPSVIIWSMGNEIMSTGCTFAKPFHDGTTPERVRRFAAAMREEDGTRPVAFASCEWFEDMVRRGEYDALDLVGWNYSGRYGFYRRARPGQAVICSESASCVSSYGFYCAPYLVTNRTDYSYIEKSKEVDSMDRNAAPWGDPPEKEFERMERDRFCAGEFVWTGIDYLGEPYPVVKWHPEFDSFKTNELARSSYFGACDLLALPKDRYYLYRANWAPDKPTLHIVPDRWTFPGLEGKALPVYVYSNAETVELFVNGESVGRTRRDRSVASAPDTFWNTHDFQREDYYALLRRYRFVFDAVTYRPGEIRAVAYDKEGRRINETVLRTAGAPKRLVLEPEAPRLDPDGETFVFVKVTAVDAKGTQLPDAKDDVAFTLEGPGEILAVGNSDARGLKSFKDVSHHPLAFGRAGLFLRRLPGKSGKITLRAAAKGLEPAEAAFDSKDSERTNPR